MLNPLSSLIPSTAYAMEANADLKKPVVVNMQPAPLPISEVVDALTSIEGELNVYTWYEGPTILTKLGARFLKDNLFEPLYQRDKTKLLLYSLEAWNFQRNVNAMNEATPKGDRINRINKTFLECMYASSFFKFCTQYNQKSPLYRLINEELPKKEWLIKLSADRKMRGKTVEELFGGQPSLVDCIKGFDVSNSYSMLQYLEGYYLVREAFVKALERGEKKVQVAFVLPNDEAKYYQDLPEDLEAMLTAEFGEELNGLELNIYFKFYNYGSSPSSRPYLGPMGKAFNIRNDEIEGYFNYIPAGQRA